MDYRIFFISIIIFIFSLQTFSYAQQSGLIKYNEELTSEGYIYFSATNSDNGYLIDNCGNLVNKWEGVNTAGLSSRLLDNGNILRADYRWGSCCEQASTGGLLEIRDWNNELVWSYEVSNDDRVQHHDFSYLPNGNILILGWEPFGHLSADYGDTSGLNYWWSEFVYELKPIGKFDAEVVWEWHLYDHFVQDVFPNLSNYGIIKDEPGKFDINYLQTSGDRYHYNAIHYNEQRDEVLISSRDVDEFYIIDHSTTTEEAKTDEGGNKGKGGDFLFRWGNPQAYDRGTFGDKILNGSHGAHWIAEGLPNENKILIFNNVARTVDLVDPQIDSNGNYVLDAAGRFAINEHTIIQEGVNSFYLSNAQQLPNGNFLINEGRLGRFTEITPDRELVWEYKVPLFRDTPISINSSNNFDPFRAYKYPSSLQGFVGKDLTSTERIEIDPQEIGSCILDSTIYVDLDGDGFFAFEDCDDNNAQVNPDAIEIPYNEIDDDCKPWTFDDDLDGDGFRVLNVSIPDCNDYNANVYPGNSEIVYNGLDDDCNTLTLDDDLDGDGYFVLSVDDTDCNDDNPDINPGAIDIPDNDIDENCDGEDATVSVKELSNNKIRIYPNPVKQHLTIEIEEGSTSHLKVEILNTTGQVLYVEDLEGRKGSQLINLNTMPTGCYFLKITDSGKVYSELLFVAR